jgi:hypothetical protein
MNYIIEREEREERCGKYIIKIKSGYQKKKTVQSN